MRFFILFFLVVLALVSESLAQVDIEDGLGSTAVQSSSLRSRARVRRQGSGGTGPVINPGLNTGQGPPPEGQGVPGAIYLDTTTGALYNWDVQTQSWVSIGTIVDPSAPGGLSVIIVSIFPPNNTVNGTVYLNPLTGTFYINQNGEWVALGSLKKPNGKPVHVQLVPAEFKKVPPGHFLKARACCTVGSVALSCGYKWSGPSAKVDVSMTKIDKQNCCRFVANNGDYIWHKFLPVVHCVGHEDGSDYDMYN